MKNKIIILVALRCLFFSFIIYLINENIELGSSPLFLSVGAILGVSITSRMAFSRLNSLAVMCMSVAGYILYRAGIFLLSLISVSKPGMYFFATVVDNHMSLFLIVFLISSVSTWLFWKVSFTLTIEMLSLLAVSIHFLSGHRNFHFESPRILNDLAWQFGLQPLSMLILLGTFILLLSLFYIYLASITNKLHFSEKKSKSLFNYGQRSILGTLFVYTFFGLLLYLINNAIYSHYNKEAISRTANGVGQASPEDKKVSPLDFHSALGSTNQPSALLRLESDYTKDPFVPMLYLRESALSEFNGKEMVIADGFDSDVNNTAPEQVYKIDPKDNMSKDRIQFVQSIFLLSDHKLAFAADYPIEIKQIKNPNNKRFKSSYRAVSLVPTFSLESIKEAQTGDKNWSPEVWKHYLANTKDERYRDLAFKITGQELTAQNQTSKIPTAEKAFEIVNFLSKNAIYTLTPNHDVKPEEDQVAPFLFGDMRGYCVHFAHATVYLLRSLGIPARIATGYLTDLSQARDGHILLRMSDRHAWAEVYLQDIGWVPFDTKPEKVESHAETQVDMKLLEELMGMLGPDEEILPDKTLENEKNVFEETKDWLPDADYILYGISAFLLLIILIKFYIRYSWKLKINPVKRLNSAYVSLASRLHDMGFKRVQGETRIEYKQRIQESLAPLLGLTSILNSVNYSGHFKCDNPALNTQISQDLKSLKKLPLKLKLFSALNPSSVFAFISGHKW